MKSAEDLSRRGNTQILVIISGLLLGLFSIISSQQFAFTQRYDVLTIDTKGAAMRAQYKAAQEERLKTRESVAAAQHKYEQAGCSANTLEPSDDCRTLKRKLERAVRLEWRLTAILERLTSLAKDVPKKQKEIAEKFSEEVSFNVGLGIKLPFTLDVAPLIWLAITIGLGLFVGLKRARFWQLVGAALRSNQDSVDPVERLPLIDVPVWLAPVPLGRDRVGLPRVALARQAGWIRSYRRRHAGMALLILIQVTASAYVTYAGLIIIDLLRHIEALQLQYGLTPTAARPFDTRIILVFLFGANIAVALWLLLPARASTRVTHPVYFNRQRRIAIGALAVGSTLTISAAFASPGLMQRVWLGSMTRMGRRWNQFRTRRPNHIDLRMTSLKPGWYCNTRSNVVHYLDRHWHMRWAKGIKPSHLAPHTPIARARSQVAEAVQTGASDRASMAPKVSHRLLEYQEEAAINLVRQRRYSEASRSLGYAASIELKGDWTTRPTRALRLLDLAAGIAIRYDLGPELLLLVIEVKQVLPKLAAKKALSIALESRLRQWTDPSGDKWRLTRWRSQPHPLRWDRGVYRI